ncbi:Microtubule-associated protein futsch [Nymphon striatum]|nr:Microtubule-associated protein futsch [Nymphon striatum]
MVSEEFTEILFQISEALLKYIILFINQNVAELYNELNNWKYITNIKFYTFTENLRIFYFISILFNLHFTYVITYGYSNTIMNFLLGKYAWMIKKSVSSDTGRAIIIINDFEGDWSKPSGNYFSNQVEVLFNPQDNIQKDVSGIRCFTNCLEKFIETKSYEDILVASEVVGNIRFSRPTLYVFPAGQGDASLFGVAGFNMLIDGGFLQRSCFWDFVRHLDRLDAILLTRINENNVNGIGTLIKRKVSSHTYPQIGHVFCNIVEGKESPGEEMKKERDQLLINIVEEGHLIVERLKELGLRHEHCVREKVSNPQTLYHKVGHGTLQMYILNPPSDGKELKDYLDQWSNQVEKFSSVVSKLENPGKEFNIPLPNSTSICALLIWKPANPNDTITRVLLPGSTPQDRIFLGLKNVREIEELKNPACTSMMLNNTIISRNKEGVKITKVMKKSKIIRKVPAKSESILKIEDLDQSAHEDSNKLAEKAIKQRVEVRKVKTIIDSKKTTKIDPLVEKPIFKKLKTEVKIKPVSATKNVEQMTTKEQKPKVIKRTKKKIIKTVPENIIKCDENGQPIAKEPGDDTTVRENQATDDNDENPKVIKRTKKKVIETVPENIIKCDENSQPIATEPGDDTIAIENQTTDDKGEKSKETDESVSKVSEPGIQTKNPETKTKKTVKKTHKSPAKSKVSVKKVTIYKTVEIKPSTRIEASTKSSIAKTKDVKDSPKKIRKIIKKSSKTTVENVPQKTEQKPSKPQTTTSTKTTSLIKKTAVTEKKVSAVEKDKEPIEKKTDTKPKKKTPSKTQDTAKKLLKRTTSENTGIKADDGKKVKKTIRKVTKKTGVAKGKKVIETTHEPKIIQPNVTEEDVLEVPIEAMPDVDPGEMVPEKVTNEVNLEVVSSSHIIKPEEEQSQNILKQQEIISKTVTTVSSEQKTSDIELETAQEKFILDENEKEIPKQLLDEEEDSLHKMKNDEKTVEMTLTVVTSKTIQETKSVENLPEVTPVLKEPVSSEIPVKDSLHESEEVKQASRPSETKSNEKKVIVVESSRETKDYIAPPVEEAKITSGDKTMSESLENVEELPYDRTEDASEQELIDSDFPLDELKESKLTLKDENDEEINVMRVGKSIQSVEEKNVAIVKMTTTVENKINQLDDKKLTKDTIESIEQRGIQASVDEEIVMIENQYITKTKDVTEKLNFEIKKEKYELTETKVQPNYLSGKNVVEDISDDGVIDDLSKDNGSEKVKKTLEKEPHEISPEKPIADKNAQKDVVYSKSITKTITFGATRPSDDALTREPNQIDKKPLHDERQDDILIPEFQSNQVTQQLEEKMYDEKLHRQGSSDIEDKDNDDQDYEDVPTDEDGREERSSDFDEVELTFAGGTVENPEYNTLSADYPEHVQIPVETSSGSASPKIDPDAKIDSKIEESLSMKTTKSENYETTVKSSPDLEEVKSTLTEQEPKMNSTHPALKEIEQISEQKIDSTQVTSTNIAETKPRALQEDIEVKKERIVKDENIQIEESVNKEAFTEPNDGKQHADSNISKSIIKKQKTQQSRMSRKKFHQLKLLVKLQLNKMLLSLHEPTKDLHVEINQKVIKQKIENTEMVAKDTTPVNNNVSETDSLKEMKTETVTMQHITTVVETEKSDDKPLTVCDDYDKDTLDETTKTKKSEKVTEDHEKEKVISDQKAKVDLQATKPCEVIQSTVEKPLADNKKPDSHIPKTPVEKKEIAEPVSKEQDQASKNVSEQPVEKFSASEIESKEPVIGVHEKLKDNVDDVNLTEVDSKVVTVAETKVTADKTADSGEQLKAQDAIKDVKQKPETEVKENISEEIIEAKQSPKNAIEPVTNQELAKDSDKHDTAIKLATTSDTTSKDSIKPESEMTITKTIIVEKAPSDLEEATKEQLTEESSKVITLNEKSEERDDKRKDIVDKLPPKDIVELEDQVVPKENVPSKSMETDSTMPKDNQKDITQEEFSTKEVFKPKDNITSIENKCVDSVITENKIETKTNIKKPEDKPKDTPDEQYRAKDYKTHEKAPSEERLFSESIKTESAIPEEKQKDIPKEELPSSLKPEEKIPSEDMKTVITEYKTETKTTITKLEDKPKGISDKQLPDRDLKTLEQAPSEEHLSSESIKTESAIPEDKEKRKDIPKKELPSSLKPEEKLPSEDMKTVITEYKTETKTAILKPEDEPKGIPDKQLPAKDLKTHEKAPSEERLSSESIKTESAIPEENQKDIPKKELPSSLKPEEKLPSEEMKTVITEYKTETKTAISKPEDEPKGIPDKQLPAKDLKTHEKAPSEERLSSESIKTESAIPEEKQKDIPKKELPSSLKPEEKLPSEEMKTVITEYKTETKTAMSKPEDEPKGIPDKQLPAKDLKTHEKAPSEERLSSESIKTESAIPEEKQNDIPKKELPSSLKPEEKLPSEDMKTVITEYKTETKTAISKPEDKPKGIPDKQLPAKDLKTHEKAPSEERLSSESIKTESAIPEEKQNDIPKKELPSSLKPEEKLPSENMKTVITEYKTETKTAISKPEDEPKESIKTESAIPEDKQTDIPKEELPSSLKPEEKVPSEDMKPVITEYKTETKTTITKSEDKPKGIPDKQLPATDLKTLEKTPSEEHLSSKSIKTESAIPEEKQKVISKEELPSSLKPEEKVPSEEHLPSDIVKTETVSLESKQKEISPQKCLSKDPKSEEKMPSEEQLFPGVIKTENITSDDKRKDINDVCGDSKLKDEISSIESIPTDSTKQEKPTETIPGSDERDKENLPSTDLKHDKEKSPTENIIESIPSDSIKTETKRETVTTKTVTVQQLTATSTTNIEYKPSEVFDATDDKDHDSSLIPAKQSIILEKNSKMTAEVVDSAPSDELKSPSEVPKKDITKPTHKPEDLTKVDIESKTISVKKIEMVEATPKTTNDIEIDELSARDVGSKELESKPLVQEKKAKVPSEDVCDESFKKEETIEPTKTDKPALDKVNKPLDNVDHSISKVDLEKSDIQKDELHEKSVKNRETGVTSSEPEEMGEVDYSKSPEMKETKELINQKVRSSSDIAESRMYVPIIDSKTIVTTEITKLKSADDITAVDTNDIANKDSIPPTEIISSTTLKEDKISKLPVTSVSTITTSQIKTEYTEKVLKDDFEKESLISKRDQTKVVEVSEKRIEETDTFFDSSEIILKEDLEDSEKFQGILGKNLKPDDFGKPNDHTDFLKSELKSDDKTPITPVTTPTFAKEPGDNSKESDVDNLPDGIQPTVTRNFDITNSSYKEMVDKEIDIKSKDKPPMTKEEQSPKANQPREVNQDNENNRSVNFVPEDTQKPEFVDETKKTEVYMGKDQEVSKDEKIQKFPDKHQINFIKKVITKRIIIRKHPDGTEDIIEYDDVLPDDIDMTSPTITTKIITKNVLIRKLPDGTEEEIECEGDIPADNTTIPFKTKTTQTITRNIIIRKLPDGTEEEIEFEGDVPPEDITMPSNKTTTKTITRNIIIRKLPDGTEEEIEYEGDVPPEDIAMPSKTTTTKTITRNIIIRKLPDGTEEEIEYEGDVPPEDIAMPSKTTTTKTITRNILIRKLPDGTEEEIEYEGDVPPEDITMPSKTTTTKTITRNIIIRKLPDGTEEEIEYEGDVPPEDIVMPSKTTTTKTITRNILIRKLPDGTEEEIEYEGDVPPEDITMPSKTTTTKTITRNIIIRKLPDGTEEEIEYEGDTLPCLLKRQQPKQYNNITRNILIRKLPDGTEEEIEYEGDVPPEDIAMPSKTTTTKTITRNILIRKLPDGTEEEIEYEGDVPPEDITMPSKTTTTKTITRNIIIRKLPDGTEEEIEYEGDVPPEDIAMPSKTTTAKTITRNIIIRKLPDGTEEEIEYEGDVPPEDIAMPSKTTTTKTITRNIIIRKLPDGTEEEIEYEGDVPPEDIAMPSKTTTTKTITRNILIRKLPDGTEEEIEYEGDVPPEDITMPSKTTKTKTKTKTITRNVIIRKLPDGTEEEIEYEGDVPPEDIVMPSKTTATKTVTRNIIIRKLPDGTEEEIEYEGDVPPEDIAMPSKTTTTKTITRNIIIRKLPDGTEEEIEYEGDVPPEDIAMPSKTTTTKTITRNIIIRKLPDGTEEEIEYEGDVPPENIAMPTKTTTTKTITRNIIIRKLPDGTEEEIEYEGDVPPEDIYMPSKGTTTRTITRNILIRKLPDGTEEEIEYEGDVPPEDITMPSKTTTTKTITRSIIIRKLPDGTEEEIEYEGDVPPEDIVTPSKTTTTKTITRNIIIRKLPDGTEEEIEYEGDVPPEDITMPSKTTTTKTITRNIIIRKLPDGTEEEIEYEGDVPPEDIAMPSKTTTTKTITRNIIIRKLPDGTEEEIEYEGDVPPEDIAMPSKTTTTKTITRNIIIRKLPDGTEEEIEYEGDVPPEDITMPSKTTTTKTITRNIIIRKLPDGTEEEIEYEGDVPPEDIAMPSKTTTTKTITRNIIIRKLPDGTEEEIEYEGDVPPEDITMPSKTTTTKTITRNIIIRKLPDGTEEEIEYEGDVPPEDIAMPSKTTTTKTITRNIIIRKLPDGTEEEIEYEGDVPPEDITMPSKTTTTKTITRNIIIRKLPDGTEEEIEYEDVPPEDIAMPSKTTTTKTITRNILIRKLPDGTEEEIEYEGDVPPDDINSHPSTITTTEIITKNILIRKLPDGTEEEIEYEGDAPPDDITIPSTTTTTKTKTITRNILIRKLPDGTEEEIEYEGDVPPNDMKTPSSTMTTTETITKNILIRILPDGTEEEIEYEGDDLPENINISPSTITKNIIIRKHPDGTEETIEYEGDVLPDDIGIPSSTMTSTETITKHILIRKLPDGTEEQIEYEGDSLPDDMNMPSSRMTTSETIRTHMIIRKLPDGTEEVIEYEGDITPDNVNVSSCPKISAKTTTKNIMVKKLPDGTEKIIEYESESPTTFANSSKTKTTETITKNVIVKKLPDGTEEIIEYEGELPDHVESSRSTIITVSENVNQKQSKGDAVRRGPDGIEEVCNRSQRSEVKSYSQENSQNVISKCDSELTKRISPDGSETPINSASKCDYSSSMSFESSIQSNRKMDTKVLSDTRDQSNLVKVSEKNSVYSENVETSSDKVSVKKTTTSLTSTDASGEFDKEDNSIYKSQETFHESSHSTVLTETASTSSWETSSTYSNYRDSDDFANITDNQDETGTKSKRCSGAEAVFSDFDPLKEWGEPLGVPSPPPLALRSQNNGMKNNKNVGSPNLPRNNKACGMIQESLQLWKLSVLPSILGKTDFYMGQNGPLKEYTPFLGSLTQDRRDDGKKKIPRNKGVSIQEEVGMCERLYGSTDKTGKRRYKSWLMFSAGRGIIERRKCQNQVELSACDNSTTEESDDDPIYLDLAYVPNHGSANYCDIDFFKRIRARYYVFSGTNPSKDVFNALLEAKKEWGDKDKDLEVTIIPTYDTDTMGYWISMNQDMLTEHKIDLAPSASRCTINLQDHETIFIKILLPRVTFTENPGAGATHMIALIDQCENVKSGIFHIENVKDVFFFFVAYLFYDIFIRSDNTSSMLTYSCDTCLKVNCYAYHQLVIIKLSVEKRLHSSAVTFFQVFQTPPPFNGTFITIPTIVNASNIGHIKEGTWWIIVVFGAAITFPLGQDANLLQVYSPQPMTHEQEVVLQVCDQGRRVSMQQISKNVILLQMKWSEVLKVLGGVCPYLNESSRCPFLLHFFLRHFLPFRRFSWTLYLNTSQEILNYSLEMLEPPESYNSPSREKIKVGSRSKAVEAPSSKMTWGQIKKSLLKTSCDYLEVEQISRDYNTRLNSAGEKVFWASTTFTAWCSTKGHLMYNNWKVVVCMCVRTFKGKGVNASLGDRYYSMYTHRG